MSSAQFLDEDHPAHTHPPASHIWDGPLATAPVALLDLEMTGLDPERDAIIEVAVHRMLATGGTLSQFGTTLRTEVPMNPLALAMHGLDEASRANAPTFAEIAPRLAALLDGAAMIAHGPSMDVAFLTRAFAACGITVPALLHPIDTITLARRAFRAPSYGLSAVCAHLKLPARRWHRAGEDVAALHDLWLSLLPTFAPPNLRDAWEIRIGQKSRVLVRTSIDQALRALHSSGAPARVFARPPGDTPTAITCAVEHYDSPHAHLRTPSGHLRLLRADRIVRVEPLPLTRA